MTQVTRYPANPITPHGAYFLLNDLRPRVRLKSPDRSVIIELMGGAAIPDRYASPESVRVNGKMKGLVGPWRFLDQQGANEDGVTFLAAHNDPVEVEIPVRVTARNGRELRKVVDHLFASLDSTRTSELSWFTQSLGFWWADVRWLQPHAGDYDIGGAQRTIELTLYMRADSGFWRTFNWVDTFRFAYQGMVEEFDVDYSERRDLGPDWPIYYHGPGGGYVYAARGRAQWRDDPSRFFGTKGRWFVAGPRRGFVTETNNQVVEIEFDTMLELGASTDIVCRMGARPDEEWNGFGTIARIEGGSVQLFAVNNFHETAVSRRSPITPPVPRERWRLEAGGLDAKGEFSERIFRVKRGHAGMTVLYAEDDDAVTPLGVSRRGVGFGGHAAGALITQGTPGAVRLVSAGDSSVSTQQGFVEMVNVGDQPMWPRYTLIGPGTFEIGNGPGSQTMVEFGPLLPGQRVQLRSDGRKRAVVDLTSTPPTAADLLAFRDALKDLESFAPIANIAPTLAANASVFGVVPPQGNMHRLIRGRFSRPVPPKPSGRKAERVPIAVSITGGNADSQIIAAGTPLRRYPLK